ncbi:hypothetical protein CHELA20_40247 [Hyphomicrobiales bacterium]|nr:hypothetical protein CHELA20_40247 [Hyphomicrobiales bacterium]CAH1687877.1 hypothetical protein CHELA41_40103 [Hyphomicrobiales bacterium]
MIDRREYQKEAMRAFLAVERSSLPIIAAVNGPALGGWLRTEAPLRRCDRRRPCRVRDA